MLSLLFCIITTILWMIEVKSWNLKSLNKSWSVAWIIWFPLECKYCLLICQWKIYFISHCTTNCVYLQRKANLQSQSSPATHENPLKRDPNKQHSQNNSQDNKTFSNRVFHTSCHDRYGRCSSYKQTCCVKGGVKVNI